MYTCIVITHPSSVFLGGAGLFWLRRGDDEDCDDVGGSPRSSRAVSRLARDSVSVEREEEEGVEGGGGGERDTSRRSSTRFSAVNIKSEC